MKITISPLRIAGALLFSWLSAAIGIEENSILVARDGSGQYRTIHEALAAVPARPAGAAGPRWVVRLKPGIYREKLVVERGQAPVTLVGEELTGTVLTGNDSAETAKSDGGKVGTFGSAGTVVLADDFAAENVTFQNAHGAGSQAVALRVVGDRAVFRHCRFLGWQDTLLLQEGRQDFEDCFVEGTVDFIFGGATAWFEKSHLHCLKSGCITAASTPEEQRYGFVFSNTRITAEKEAKTLLGRPWRPFGSVAFLRCALPPQIRPEGWNNWDDPARERTARFAEYGSKGGPPAGARAPWAKVLTEDEAKRLTVKAVLGGADGWEPAALETAIAPDAIEWGLAQSRIATLEEAERVRWAQYLERSAAALQGDREALFAEVKAAGLAEPLPAPEGAPFKLPAQAAEWFGSEAALKLAQTIVSFQTPSGGWGKNASYDGGPRRPGMHWSAQATAETWHYVGTIDNGATTGQMELLARIYQATKREELKTSFVRGLKYLLAAQFPTGGWPQVYPIAGGYHDAITYNDDAMVHVLELLQRIAQGDPALDFAAEFQAPAAAAVEAGVQCLLRSQIVQAGKPTAWCAQHDPLSLAPVSARLKEPVSLSGGESMAILRFLMRRPKPGSGEREAIEAGLAWFERAKLLGWRAVSREGRQRWEQDPTATEPMWARFYDVQSNQPIFAGAQDGIVYDSFETMERNNAFGYAFFTPKPQELLTKEQLRWRKTLP